ncbi:MAG: hypothetical protein R3D98_09430 [Candidatus Krumholzibacteriia bacterium]
MAVKICSDCGAEYLPTAQVCADCGGRLGYFADDGSRPAVVDPDARIAVFLGPYRDACRLQALLERQEITSLVEERTDLELHGFREIEVDVDRPGYYEVLVAAADRDAATRLRQSADLPDELLPEAHDFVEGRCPACGFAFAADPGIECPDCGLRLGGWDDEDEDAEPGAAARGSGSLPQP